MNASGPVRLLILAMPASARPDIALRLNSIFPKKVGINRGVKAQSVLSLVKAASLGDSLGRVGAR